MHRIRQLKSLRMSDMRKDLDTVFGNLLGLRKFFTIIKAVIKVLCGKLIDICSENQLWMFTTESKRGISPK